MSFILPPRRHSGRARFDYSSLTNNRVRVAVDVEDRTPPFAMVPVGRSVVLRQLFFQLAGVNPYAPARFSARVAAQVAHGIDAHDAADLVGIPRPVVEPSARPGLGQQPRLRFQLVFPDHVRVKLRETFAPPGCRTIHRHRRAH